MIAVLLIVVIGLFIYNSSDKDSQVNDVTVQITAEEEAKVKTEVITFLREKNSTEKTNCLATEENKLAPSEEVTLAKIVVDNDGDRVNVPYCSKLLFLAKTGSGWDILASTDGAIVTEIIAPCALESLVAKTNEVLTQGLVDDTLFKDKSSDDYKAQVTDVIAKCQALAGEK